MLKTLERILDLEIRSGLVATPLNESQHAYVEGRSTDTALHEVVSTVERSIHYKQYTMAAFLDIEGALNNIRLNPIIEALDRPGLEPGLVHWIGILLRSRVIVADLGGSHVCKVARRGTPQGGVLSPLLWILVMDKILRRLQDLGIKAVAYADDLVVMVSGICPAIYWGWHWVKWVGGPTIVASG